MRRGLAPQRWPRAAARGLHGKPRRPTRPRSQQARSSGGGGGGGGSGDWEVLGGQHAVAAALWAASRERYGRLLLQTGVDNYFGSKDPNEILAPLLERGVDLETRMVSREKLDAFNPYHRGVALEVSVVEAPKVTATCPTWRNAKGRTVALLDQVQDPHNMGAMLRSAWFLGVDDIVISSKKSAPLSEAVARVSAGALDMFIGKKALWKIEGSTADFLQAMHSDKGWRTVGTRAGEDGALAASDLHTDENVILVMGSEGAGLRKKVLHACSDFMSIPGRKDGLDEASGHIVDSLNVSVAFGLLAAALVHRGPPASR